MLTGKAWISSINQPANCDTCHQSKGLNNVIQHGIWTSLTCHCPHAATTWKPNRRRKAGLSSIAERGTTFWLQWALWESKVLETDFVARLGLCVISYWHTIIFHRLLKALDDLQGDNASKPYDPLQIFGWGRSNFQSALNSSRNGVYVRQLFKKYVDGMEWWAFAASSQSISFIGTAVLDKIMQDSSSVYLLGSCLLYLSLLQHIMGQDWRIQTSPHHNGMPSIWAVAATNGRTGWEDTAKPLRFDNVNKGRSQWSRGTGSETLGTYFSGGQLRQLQWAPHANDKNSTRAGDALLQISWRLRYPRRDACQSNCLDLLFCRT